MEAELERSGTGRSDQLTNADAPGSRPGHFFAVLVSSAGLLVTLKMHEIGLEATQVDMQAALSG